MSKPASSLDFAAVAKDVSPSRQALASLCNEMSARTFAELGVWKGALAALLLKECPTIEEYWMIDPWRHLGTWNKPYNVAQAQFDAVYDEAMAATAFAAGRRRVLRGTTGEVIDQIPDESLDVAYVDGDHTLRGVAIDLISIWPKIRAGGLLLGDDLATSIWQHGTAFEPTLVFPFAVHFAEAQRSPFHCLGATQFAIPKPEAAPEGYVFHDHTGCYGSLELLPQIRAYGTGAGGRLRRRLARLVKG